MTGTMPPRALPLLDDNNTAYWTGGEKGDLLIHRCSACGYYVHPPVNFCPECEGREVAPQPVSGKGTVETFTVVHQQWVPGLEVPYVLALVTMAEQDDVRLACNIVNCAPDEVTFGMPLKVLFEQNEDVWVPLFEPDPDAGDT